MVTTITVVPVHPIELMKSPITTILVIIPMPILLRVDCPITKVMTDIIMDIIKAAFTVMSITIMENLIMAIIILETVEKEQAVAMVLVAYYEVENN
jgi:hypothetical protein